ncbi:MAG: T9SS type A sorting domain-containing protein, partial [Bacteroidia bacterium]
IYVEQHNAESDLDLTGVYPNPVVEGKLTIYLKNVDVNDTYDMTLYNLLGQPILVWNLEAVSNQQIIGFLGLQGAYIFKIRQGGEQIATGKLLMGQ